MTAGVHIDGETRPGRGAVRQLVDPADAVARELARRLSQTTPSRAPAPGTTQFLTTGDVDQVQQTVAQNMDQGLPSNSALPHVRSDFIRYARAGTTSIPALYVERMWNPAPDWFARLSAGLLEPMFGGAGGELLWRPHDGALALGVDVNVLAQRNNRQRFSMLGYNTATGHASAYWDTPWWNVYTVVQAGRYLAGDWGATLEVGRRFDSGVEIGGFATLTNVGFSRFGEGSFDKGIFIRIPFDLFGPSTRARANLNFRTVQRDGGQRLSVDNPLWDVSRDGRADAFRAGFGGFMR